MTLTLDCVAIQRALDARAIHAEERVEHVGLVVLDGQAGGEGFGEGGEAEAYLQELLAEDEDYLAGATTGVGTAAGG